ncbi:MAG: CGNR zinc finger domain-containing protein [Candidatus Binatus sp.]|nr:CGNR zinc finger domain-containing protein [Candidatus Binatus sp.]
MTQREPSEILQEAIAGFSQATRRVGSDDRKRLSWLLEFVYLSEEKLAELSESEKAQLCFDLAYFANISGQWELPPLEEIASLASEIRNGIDRLRRTRRWVIELPKDSIIERIIEPRPKRRAGHIRLDGYHSFYGSDDFRTSFLLCAADTAEAEGTRIRVCAQKDCGRMFARHRRARYCSSRCSQKERDLRFRKRFTKTERRERRQRYYKNRMAKLHGPAVASKVKPRPVKPTPRK